MKRKLSKPRRVTSWPAVLLTILTIACLLSAPLCAPLCAASLCAPGDGAPEHCHAMADAAAPHDAIAPQKICGRLEFSAVLVKLDEQFWQAQRLCATTVPLASDTQESSSSGRTFSEEQQRGAQRVPIEEYESFLSATVLRI